MNIVQCVCENCHYDLSFKYLIKNYIATIIATAKVAKLAKMSIALLIWNSIRIIIEIEVLLVKLTSKTRIDSKQTICTFIDQKRYK